MKIAMAADHAGWKDKTWLVDYVRSLGHEVVDFGTDSDAACDYPDYAARATAAVADGRCDQGIFVCGTGIGMSIVANKFRGIRAANCWCPEAARYARTHNDANVLCLGSRLTASEAMRAIVDAWLSAAFQGGRHERRVQKIRDLEKGLPC